MFELLAFVGLIVVGVFVLKLIFGLFGLAIHLILLPIKLALGLVAVVIALPFLVLLLPVFLVLGLGFAVVGTVVCSVFCWFL